MRIRWWESIRWRLALGSMLIVLLATTILAFSAIVAIAYYYNREQTQNVRSSTYDEAQKIGSQYALSSSLLPVLKLRKAVTNTVSVYHQSVVTVANSTFLQIRQGEEYQFLVISTRGRVVYPAAKSVVSVKLLQDVVIAYDRACPRANSDSDAMQICTAIENAKTNHTATTDQIGKNVFLPRTFTVVPITVDGNHDSEVVGVLVLLTPADTISTPFVQSITQSVIFVALVVAVIAAILAIIFSRTITRPLAKLTNASHVLASGDYNARVVIKSHGEIGELAQSFNDMASQLSRDVEELRQQELWRRELIMSITHDLATPLTAIAGLGESLVDGVTQTREEYEATGKIIVRETLRLRRLVKDLHVMAKVEAGVLHPQRKDLRLAALVDEILAVLAPEFERAEIEPFNAVNYTIVVQADSDMLTRVFSNLFANAIRHTPPGGSVTIEAEPQGDTLRISVSDTGEGIPPEALSLIFERFYRADSARQSATGGSGLGLAIVRAIVEAHGGTIHAENAASGGARIVFTLPYIQANISQNDALYRTISEEENATIEMAIADTMPLRIVSTKDNTSSKLW